ncbi:MAG: DUF2141 domain-containing protein [Bacteroidota bacterium]
MIKRFYFVFLCALIAAFANAQTDSLRTAPAQDSVRVKKDTLLGSIKIIIKGCRTTGGKALVALYNKSNGFMKKEPLRNASEIIKSNQLTVQFDSLGKGNYAVAIIHDENGNGILDKNDMGIPVEGYGFSNDARGTFGPPEFKDAKFWFAGQNKTMVINMVYTNAGKTK